MRAHLAAIRRRSEKVMPRSNFPQNILVFSTGRIQGDVMFHERTKFKYVQYFYLAIMAILRVYKGNPIEKKSGSLVSAFTGNNSKDHSVHLNFF